MFKSKELSQKLRSYCITIERLQLQEHFQHKKFLETQLAALFKMYGTIANLQGNGRISTISPRGIKTISVQTIRRTLNKH